MKNILKTGLMMVLATLLFVACEPQEFDEYDLGAAPDESQLDFTITQDSEDEFNYIIENTSSVTGIASWNLGGTKKTGNKVTQRFPLPGEYEVSLTLATQGGSATLSETLTTEETDWAFLESEEMQLISGGVDATEGKTWVLDSLSAGHLGVGPAGSAGLDWWAAAPLAKQPVGVLYDDKITFKLVGFDFIYENRGESYVKDFRSSDPAYTDAEQRDTDYKVNFDPSSASWNLEEDEGKWYLSLSTSDGSPIFPIFDVGAENNRYQVLALEENKLELVAIGGDGNAWHYSFIPEGYVPPQIELEVNLTETGEVNTYNVSLNVLNVPADESINNVIVDFGNGTVHETQDVNEVVSNTYMRKGSYQVTVTANTSLGDIVNTFTADVAANHPDYEPFLLDAMVTYNDFSEVSMAPMNVDQAGGSAYIEVIDNPSRIYPNKSAKALKLVKENNEWANAYMQLPAGYRFDLRQRSTFKVMVYGNAGDEVLLKLENTDRGGNAWQTGTYDLIYTIQQDNTWEVAEFDFSEVGAGWDWTGDIYTSNVTTDDNFSHDFYNVVRIMINPGNADGTFQVYLDELAGPHVEGLKSAIRN
jgi:hypothetical protein